MKETLNSRIISTKLQRIAKLASEDRSRVLHSLHHHIDKAWLHEAYRRTQKRKAVGVDGVTAQEYEANLDANLVDLLNRFKSGSYYAPPVRRVYISKGKGKTRPIGIPTFEDKILQRAVTMLLNAIYEQDFHCSSYGFRQSRGCHDALQSMWETMMRQKGGWVLELDIQNFFGALVPWHLRAFLDLRVRDGVIRRSIDKWLRAGVVEEGQVRHPDTGTPQGGVISPLLANVYLHHVLDSWFEREVKPRMKGQASLFRYADDAVIVFASERDARRVLEVLPRRFERFGLTLHPEKTKLLPFFRPKRNATKEQLPGSFDFLGFMHFWGLSRKGTWVVKRKTASERFGRAVKRTTQWCRRNRHLRVKDQYKTLSKMLIGHYNYYGFPDNARALSRFYYEVRRNWHKWLSRRSQRAYLSWDRFADMLRAFPLPQPRCFKYKACRAVTLF